MQLEKYRINLNEFSKKKDIELEQIKKNVYDNKDTDDWAMKNLRDKLSSGEDE